MNAMGMFKEKVTIEPFLSRDKNGKKTYGPPKVYNATVGGRSRLVQGRTGGQFVSRIEVLIATSDVISLDDRITLPSGNVPQQPPILFISAEADDRGNVQFSKVRA